MLGRAALETCIIGLYCVFSGEVVAELSAANYKATGKVIAYLSDDGLVSKEAIASAARSLGELRKARSPVGRRYRLRARDSARIAALIRRSARLP